MSVCPPQRPGAMPPGQPPRPPGRGPNGPNGPGGPGGPPPPPPSGQTGPPRPPMPPRPRISARRRTIGASFGALPVSNLVVLEVGVAVGLILLAINLNLKWVALGIAVVALLIAAIRWHGRWFTQWVGLTMRYAFRSHEETV